MSLDPRVVDLYNEYIHSTLPRRDFLARLTAIVGSAAAVAAVLPLIEPNYVQARQVEENDKRLSVRRLEYNGPSGMVRGYLARPKGKTKLPGIVVIHENRGLNPHIEDITRRLAVDGFLAYAPDALAASGGWPGDEDKAREAFAKLDANKTRADFVAAARALLALPEGNGKVGVVGFCFGGGMANYLATQVPELAAAVPFYGGQPPAADVAKIKAPLLIHYAGQDERINAGWPGYEAALKANGVAYEAHIYAGTQHGFNNDTTPRYDADAARLAWQRTLAFFKARLV